MQPLFYEDLSLIGFIIVLFSIVYSLIAIKCLSSLRRSSSPHSTLPPVTMLKPVCGLDADLYQNLSTFCQQDYPEYQIIFGVREDTDPAIPIIEKLIRDFPDVDIELLINDHMAGSNHKISNIINMYHKVKHNLLVISDSDMRVCKDYLRNVTAPFENPQVGAVTCLYKGVPATVGLASRLGTIYINEWFLPSVLVSKTLQEVKFCFGATMAVRKELLEKIGGFEHLASFLADDYMLGRLINQLGYKVVLSKYIVNNIVEESDIKSLFSHELRWARTIRTVQPIGYTFSFLTHTFPLSILYCTISPSLALSTSVIFTAFFLRLRLHNVARRSLDIHGPSTPVLILLRDILSFLVWATSFFGRNVYWRQNNFSIQANGQMAIKES